MSRIPIRLRVTLVFALAMVLVLGAVGAFLYVRLGDQLDESIDNGLRTRAGEVAAFVRDSGPALGASAEVALIESEESFAQVLEPEGEVIDSTPQLEGQAVLDPGEVAEALEGPRYFERESLPGVEGRARLLATPVQANEDQAVVVVGASLDDRREALSGLARQLLIGGPIALVLASLAAYWAAGGALRPVDEMRRRAATISAGGPDARLPVPPAGDELTRLGETLNAMLGRLDTAIERERRFTDDAAHELRTPLALHRAELELALRDTDADAEELRRAMASSIVEVDRLVQLAEDLLVVARSDGGQLALAPERLRAGELLDGVAERFRARARRSGRELRVEDGRRSSWRAIACASSRRSTTWSTTRCATARARCGCGPRATVRSRSWSPTRVRASRTASRRGRSSASAGPMRPGDAVAAGSASRSSRRSPAPTAVRPRPRTARTAAPRSESTCRNLSDPHSRGLTP